MKLFGDTELVPGTVHLVDVEGNLHVKKNKGGNEKIILRPPPSSDPNDPLRWSRKKKLFQFFLLFWLGVFLAITVAWTSPSWLIISDDLNTTVAKMNDAMALTFLGLGLGCVFLQPTALKLGRRFVYLFCCVLMMVGNLIGSQAKSISYIFGAFFITGFAAAPCDSLLEISSCDVFFQHERASFLSLFILALYFGNYIAPAISGYVVEALGWKWSYYLQIILFGASFVLLFIFMEDSTFRRTEDDETFEENIMEQIKSRESTKEHNNVAITDGGSDTYDDDSDYTDPSIPVRSLWQRRHIIQLTYNDTRSWLCIWYRPFFLITLPPVVWGGLIYGAQMMWLSLIAVTQATIYQSPPYNFSPSTTGLINFSPLVGNIFGMLYGGKFVDWLSIKLSQKNNGIMEPEFRLYAMIVPTILNAIGLMTYGIANHNGAPWPISVIIGIGCLGFAMTSTGAITLTYAIDCYPKLQSESMVLMLFIRNMIGMVFTFIFLYWLAASGLKQLTWLLFMLSILINGSFVVFIFFGKRIRRWTSETYFKVSDPSYGELFKN